MMDIYVQSYSIVDELPTELPEGFDKIPGISQEWSVELTSVWDANFDLLQKQVARLFNLAVEA